MRVSERRSDILLGLFDWFVGVVHVLPLLVYSLLLAWLRRFRPMSLPYHADPRNHHFEAFVACGVLLSGILVLGLPAGLGVLLGRSWGRWLVALQVAAAAAVLP